MGNNKCINTRVQLKNKSVQHRQKTFNKTTQCTEEDLEEDLDSFEQFMTVLLLIIYLALIYYMASGWAIDTLANAHKQRFQ